MKVIFFLVALMSISSGAIAEGNSYFYTVIVLSSGRKVMNCEKADGSYRDFVFRFKNQAARLSMSCTDMNEGKKTLFNVGCGDGNMGMMSAFWFQSEVECQEAVRKERRTGDSE